MVRDGDSETKASDDPSRRQRFVDKGLDHVLERKEWGERESMEYLSAAYVLLESKEMSVRWLTPSAPPQRPAKGKSKKRSRVDGVPKESRVAAVAAPPPPPVVSDDDPRPSVYTADFRRKVAIAAMNKGSRSIKDVCREFGGVSKTSVYAWMREFKEENPGEGATASVRDPSAPLPEKGTETDDEEVIDVEDDDAPTAAAPARRVGPYPLEFKQKVALEAEVEGRKGVRDRKTLKEIAAKHEVNESTVSNWKRQFGPDSILGDLLSFNFKASELDALIERIEREPLIAEATISERFCEKNGLERCYGVFEGFNQCKTEAYGPMKQDFLDELKKRKIERERRQKKAAAAVSESDDSDVSSSEEDVFSSEDEVLPKYADRKKYSDKDGRHKKHKHKKRDY
ncbi:MAG: hypothetical protein K2Q34_08145 [Alphaproteobacteria bacterium]|nr:hypothetical protein [Alphaproteobacteria bacterium]